MLIRHTTELDWPVLKAVRLAALLDAPTAFGVTPVPLPIPINNGATAPLRAALRLTCSHSAATRRSA